MRLFLRVVGCAVIGSSALLIGGMAPAGATLYEVDLDPKPAPQAMIDLIDSDVETNTGSGVSTLDNGHPNTWVAEDADAVLAPDEDIRYRLAAYDLSYPAEDCAEYEIELTLEVTATGPDIGVGDNLFFGVLDAADNPVDGDSSSSPASIGDSIEMSITGNPTPDGLRAGYQLGYGATTAQRGTPNISSGYTITTPDVVLTEDLSGCDLDEDGIADDIDDAPLDPCRPDEETNACVLHLAATATTTTTTTTVPGAGPTEPGSASATPTPTTPPSSSQPAALAATGASLTLFALGATCVVVGGILVSRNPTRRPVR